MLKNPPGLMKDIHNVPIQLPRMGSHNQPPHPFGQLLYPSAAYVRFPTLNIDMNQIPLRHAAQQITYREHLHLFQLRLLTTHDRSEVGRISRVVTLGGPGSPLIGRVFHLGEKGLSSCGPYRRAEKGVLFRLPLKPT